MTTNQAGLRYLRDDPKKEFRLPKEQLIRHNRKAGLIIVILNLNFA
jgi:hypothetical protein